LLPHWARTSAQFSRSQKPSWTPTTHVFCLLQPCLQCPACSHSPLCSLAYLRPLVQKPVMDAGSLLVMNILTPQV
jgi:hypothetical protein